MAQHLSKLDANPIKFAQSCPWLEGLLLALVHAEFDKGVLCMVNLLHAAIHPSQYRAAAIVHLAEPPSLIDDLKDRHWFHCILTREDSLHSV